MVRPTGVVNEVLRGVGQVDLCYSQEMVAGMSCSHGVCFCRGVGTRPFTRRDAALLHLAHVEIARLWRRGREVTAVRLTPGCGRCSTPPPAG